MIYFTLFNCVFCCVVRNGGGEWLIGLRGLREAKEAEFSRMVIKERKKIQVIFEGVKCGGEDKRVQVIGIG